MKRIPNFVQILTTTAKKGDAEKIANVLLDKKLSACTQIVGPITSIYRWQGKKEKSKEWLCVIKTERNHYKKIERLLQKIHPYKLPEIIATPIINGSLEYLAWMRKPRIKKQEGQASKYQGLTLLPQDAEPHSASEY